MPIEYKFGPPVSALGRMAYQVGAGEAARKREQEERERRMQLLRMQQQQQEASLGRRMDAWRTQYQHTSAMQKMQSEHEWRDGIQKREWEHQKGRFDHETNVKFDNDVELNRLRGLENERVGYISHINGMKKQADYFEQLGKNKEASEVRQDVSVTESRMRGTLNETTGKPAWDQFSGQILKIRGDEKLSPKEKSDQEQQVRQQQYALLQQDNMKLKGLNEVGGWEDRGSIRWTNNGDGSYSQHLLPGHSLEQWKQDTSWKPKLRRNPQTNDVEESYAEIKLTDKGKMYVETDLWSFKESGGPTDAERKVIQKERKVWKKDTFETRIDLNESLFELDDTVDSYAPDGAQAWKLTSQGEALLAEAPAHIRMDGAFMAARPDDRARLVAWGAEQKHGPEPGGEFRDLKDRYSDPATGGQDMGRPEGAPQGAPQGGPQGDPQRAPQAAPTPQQRSQEAQEGASRMSPEDSERALAGAEEDEKARHQQAAENRKAFKTDTTARRHEVAQRGELPIKEGEFRGPRVDMSKHGGKSYGKGPGGRVGGGLLSNIGSLPLVRGATGVAAAGADIARKHDPSRGYLGQRTSSVLQGGAARAAKAAPGVVARMPGKALRAVASGASRVGEKLASIDPPGDWSVESRVAREKERVEAREYEQIISKTVSPTTLVQRALNKGEGAAKVENLLKRWLADKPPTKKDLKAGVSYLKTMVRVSGLDKKSKKWHNFVSADPDFLDKSLGKAAGVGPVGAFRTPRVSADKLRRGPAGDYYKWLLDLRTDLVRDLSELEKDK